MKPTIKAPKTAEGILQNKQANRNNNTLGMQFGELSTNHCKEVVPYELNRKGDTGTKVTDMAVVEEANKRWKAATDKMKMAEFKNETIKVSGQARPCRSTFVPLQAALIRKNAKYRTMTTRTRSLCRKK